MHLPFKGDTEELKQAVQVLAPPTTDAHSDYSVSLRPGKEEEGWLCC